MKQNQVYDFNSSGPLDSFMLKMQFQYDIWMSILSHISLKRPQYYSEFWTLIVLWFSWNTLYKLKYFVSESKISQILMKQFCNCRCLKIWQSLHVLDTYFFPVYISKQPSLIRYSKCLISRVSLHCNIFKRA